MPGVRDLAAPPGFIVPFNLYDFRARCHPPVPGLLSVATDAQADGAGDPGYLSGVRAVGPELRGSGQPETREFRAPRRPATSDKECRRTGNQCGVRSALSASGPRHRKAVPPVSCAQLPETTAGIVRRRGIYSGALRRPDVGLSPATR